MTKAELIEEMEIFSDDIRIVVLANNGKHQPIKSAIYEYDARGEAIITLSIGRDKK